ncbi:MAG: hypothetical protein JO257_38060, partial [Deltaproteobacteria bacterium]|nr:hypothetical protein [Deltaproteobacteria bacterium]
MIKIAFPFSSRARSSDLADLHVALRVLLNGAAVNAPEDVRRTLEADLEREQLEWIFGEATRKLVQLIQTQHGLSGAGEVDATTAELIQRLFNDHANATLSEVKGTVSSADGSPIHDVVVRAFARHLRAERSVGLAHTSADGSYCIRYAGPHSSRGLDLVVKALDRHGAALSASPIAFEAPRELVIDLAIPADKFQPVPLFDRILGGVDKVRGDLAVADLEQDAEHDDLVYLAGELRIDRSTVARLCMAYRLASRTLPPQAWFALLGAGGFQYDDTQSLSSQRDAYLAKLSTLDDAGIAKALDAAFSRNDIALKLREHRGAWIAGMSEAAAGHSVQTSDAGKLVSAVLHAVGVRDAATQQRFVRMYAASRRLTPELLGALAQDPSLTPEQVADLSAALRISELANADFTLVSTVRDQHRIRRPEQVAQLAKLSLDEWQATVEKAVAAGARVPLDIANDHVPVAPSTTTLYARDLERTFRETFPTAAFAGGLQRATAAGRAHGFTQPEQLSAFLDAHPQFELDRTPIDTFLANGIAPALSTVRDDAAFRSQLKAAQRVFKLASTFDATNSLLADGVHSAQAVYRIGATGFVRAYGNRPGFTPDTARIAWNRAAETHAMVLTIVGDLKSLDGETLPAALRSADTAALQTFPNWNNLFQGGDICECQECRSVLSPTAYFTDLLMFLRDRKTGTGKSVKDVLFTRRPDLGFLELSCDNANTTLPYIDVVCEVLERVVAAGDNDVELAGFASMPATDTAAHAAVAAALAAANVDVGATFTLTAVPAPATNEWVVHGETAVYLLKKKATPNFFAVILPNTKASADELRAYPAYVDPAAYAKLREIGFPFALPFDLFAEEVRAFFLTCDLRRWELMDTFRGPSAPTNPSDVDIACEYFAISSNPTAATDEHRLILDEDLTAAGQQVLWGEAGNAAWLSTVANVARFLNKTSLAYVDLLVLLDLKFINPTGSIQIEHDDNSCDTYKKNLTSLDPAALDRIHRFLRMWRKLPGWKMWELDLAIRCSGIGNGVVDEQFVVQLFYAARLKQRLGSRATVEQICGLVSNLSTETYFTKLHEPRKDGLYQSIYLNRRLVQPLDHAFDVSAVDVPPPTTEKISGHRSVIIAALGLSEADLDVLIRLRKASDGSLYLTDDLTLASLSFLWRHGWLAKQLKIKPAVWQLAVQLLAQDVEAFANARVAFEYVEMLDQATQSGFTMDQLDWILAADRSAKSAPKDADVTRFLTSLRAELQTIHASYDPTQYDFLSPPTDVDRLTALLTSLLQQLDRDDSAAQFFIATLSDTVQQQVAVTGLPVGFDFPGSIKSTITIRYDEPSHVLRFSGLMTTAQRTTLLTDPSLAPVTALPSYQQAIAALFDAPRLAIKFLDPVFVAPLAVLPPAVDFRMLSAGLAQRVSYDVENREVRIVGVLSAEDVNALDGLSADPSYRGAVQSLFTQPRAGTFPLEVLWLEDADLSFPLRDLDHPASDHLATNLATAITKALAYLTKTQSEGSVIRQASAQLALSESLTRDLFTEYAIFPPGTLLQHFTGPFAGSSGAIDYNAAKPTFDGWGWAVRAALLWKQWHVTADEVDALTRIASSAKLLDLLSLPLDSGGPLASLDRLVRTSRLRRFAASVPEGNVTVLDVLGRLGTYASVMAFADDVAAFNDTWSANDVAALVSALDAAYPADYYLAETWARIARAFSFARALAASTATADRFAAATMTDADARVLRDLLRAKFGADTWLSLSAQVQDTIRERKRDALAAYLLAQPQPTDAPSGKWDDTNDLYAYYLLDVEMCSCQLTSRLVQGSGSIQLFVQRCFMGLEPQVAVVDSGDDGDTAWLWWRWMSKYRVWEANRKIFLWPENWIEPELKKDRSSFFKDLENDLLQNETTQENVEKAFTSYLEKLDAVAQLEIAGFYQEDNGDETIVHVFGRTLGAEPHIYYYRRFDYRQWTPWEKVDLDIKGDYLIPAVVGGRLFLFWPVFTEVPDEDSASTATIPAATPGSTTVKKTSKRLKLQMAVSDYRQGRWTPRRLSKEYVETASYDVEITRKHYTFYPVDRTDIDGRFGVKFKGYSVDRNDKPLASLYGGFEITGCQGVPIASDLPGDILLMIRPELESTGTDTTFNKWEELTSRADAPSSDFTLLNTLFGPVETNALTPVLAQTPPQTRLRLFDMIPAWHASYLDRLLADGIAGLTNIQRYWITPVGTWLPWFFGDQKRTFFVLPVLWKGGKRDGNDPGTVTGYYYPYVKQVVRQMEAFYRAQVEQYVAGLDLTQLTPAERAAAEQFLAQQFPSENIPPFTD